MLMTTRINYGNNTIDICRDNKCELWYSLLVSECCVNQLFWRVNHCLTIATKFDLSMSGSLFTEKQLQGT